MAAIALVTALYVGAWHGHKSLLGWASDDVLPERFRLHYATVEDPDKASRTPGTIYLWVSSLDGPAAPGENHGPIGSRGTLKRREPFSMR